MYKNKYLKIIIFLISFIAIVSLLVSASSAARYEPTEKIDSGKKIIKIANEKYNIKWETNNVTNQDQDKKYVYITYKSVKNKKNKGYLYITIDKTSKNKITITKTLSSMRLGTSKTIKTKLNTDKYYWKKLRPNLKKILEKPILNKEILRYNKTRYLNRIETDPANNETIITEYKMNWMVYYYSKTSSIEIIERYTILNTTNTSNNTIGTKHFYFNLDQDILIEKYKKGKLKVTIYPYGVMKVCGSVYDYKYIKTDLSPKKYYLKVYKKKLETKNFRI